MAITDLCRVVAPPSSVSFEASMVGLAALGVCRLPSDYLQLVGLFGPGCFDGFLWLLVPGCANRNLDLGSQITQRLSVQYEVRSAGWSRYSPAIFPEPGGILPWGITDNGDVCFWQTTGGHPDAWTVVVMSDRGDEWSFHEEGVVGFLERVFGTVGYCPVFPDDWPSRHPRFECLDAIA